MNETQIHPIDLAKTLLKSVAAEQGWSYEGDRARVTKRFDLEIRRWDLGVVVVALRNWRKLEGINDQVGRQKILELACLLQNKQQKEEVKTQPNPDAIFKDEAALVDVVADRFVIQTGYRLDKKWLDERSSGLDIGAFSLDQGPKGTIIKGINMRTLTTRFAIEVPTSLAVDICQWLRKMDWLDRYNQEPEQAVKSPPVSTPTEKASADLGARLNTLVPPVQQRQQPSSTEA